MNHASVLLWGRQIGAVEWDESRQLGVFQYIPQFAGSGIQVAPLTMPLSPTPYSFPTLREAFHGLPGLLADSLPDKFGTRLINAWLAMQGRPEGSMNAVERLCYTGHRGMGALEFEPDQGPEAVTGRDVDIEALTRLANRMLDERAALAGTLAGKNDRVNLQEILRVGTSAGGARAKALLGWNPQTGEFRSGQLDLPAGFEHWLLKFDGISNNRDHELADPMGYGLIEYTYALMASEAGIEMMPCRIHTEGGRHHFMTRRFDRTQAGKKLHMQSLAAMRHFDFNDPLSYSYEQAMETIRRISAEPAHDLRQQFLRAVFNVVARNQDDHVKNIAFLMRPDGSWRLAPAFDLTYAYNPQGSYTGRHQMSLNGKRDNFELNDLLALASSADIKARQAKNLIQQVTSSVERWKGMAEEQKVHGVRIKKIANTHRIGFIKIED
jgi:serine/threonine-protein kinase HipA